MHNMQIIKLFTIFILFFCFFSKNSFAEKYIPKVSINGSGLNIPRMVSLKKVPVYMRTGPGLKYPIKYEYNKAHYPMNIIGEFNNWRKVNTINNIKGWIHTSLLSSLKTGLIIETTILKKTPFDKSKSIAKLLPNLLVEIKNCNEIWCKILIIKNQSYTGWVKKRLIWGSTKNKIN